MEYFWFSYSVIEYKGVVVVIYLLDTIKEQDTGCGSGGLP